VAYDKRFLSEKFAYEFARVLAGNGIKVLRFIKAVPTPLAAFAIRQMEAGGAIMITASHNPPEYNGIKFIPEYAGPALPEVTSAIEEEVNRILNGGKVYEIDLAEALTLDLLTDIDLDKEYATHLLRVINPDFIKEKSLRIVADPMYGAGIGYLERILNEVGVKSKPSTITVMPCSGNHAGTDRCNPRRSQTCGQTYQADLVWPWTVMLTDSGLSMQTGIS
jgi:phosphomannomutase